MGSRNLFGFFRLGLHNARAVMPWSPAPTHQFVCTLCSCPLVLENRDLVFCTVPKVGSTVWRKILRFVNACPQSLDSGEVSGKAYFELNCPSLGLQHLSDYSIQRQDEILTNFTTATLLRHPLARFLSAYLSKIEKKEGMSFEDFVMQVERKPDKKRNEHWQSQTLLCGLDTIKYDWVGRWDLGMGAAQPSLALMSNMSRSMGIPYDLLKERFFTSERDHGGDRMDQYYTEALRQRVSRLYRQDICFFETGKVEC